MKYRMLYGMVHASKCMCLCQFNRVGYLIGFIQFGKFVRAENGTEVDFKSGYNVSDKEWEITADNDDDAIQKFIDLYDIIASTDSYKDSIGGGK